MGKLPGCHEMMLSCLTDLCSSLDISLQQFVILFRYVERIVMVVERLNVAGNSWDTEEGFTSSYGLIVA